MTSSKKRSIAIISVLCAALLAACGVLAVGWRRAATAAAALPQVRNDGTTIQWRYGGDENAWRDLVSVADLQGAAGQNGADGKNGKDGVDGRNGTDGTNGIDGKDGVNGKDGADGKSVEVRRGDRCIEWRIEGGTWQELVALADISGPAGQNGTDGADGAAGTDGRTPEFRVEEGRLQWRYIGDEIWLTLYDLSVLRGVDGKDGINGKDGIDGKDGADGENGVDGKDGKDGNDGDTPFIGDNGNWWIGTADTGIKAAGQNGADGAKGDKGDKGEKGDQGNKGEQGETGPAGPAGPAGQNGSTPGWFFCEGSVQGVHLKNGAVTPYYQRMMSGGGRVTCDGTTFKLKKGHHYQVSISGAFYAMSEDSNGHYALYLTDGRDEMLCRDLTCITVDGRKLNETRREQHSVSLNRVYDATGGDVTLRFYVIQGEYDTYLLRYRGTVTITALD